MLPTGLCDEGISSEKIARARWWRGVRPEDTLGGYVDASNMNAFRPVASKSSWLEAWVNPASWLGARLWEDSVAPAGANEIRPEA